MVENKSRWKLYFGIGILLFLGLSYFIQIPVDSGNNYNVNDTLLGLIIFHNPFILLLYIVLDFVFLIFPIIRK